MKIGVRPAPRMTVAMLMSSPSAGSRDLLCERIDLLALEVLTDPLADLGRRQLPIRLQDRPLAVHPARLDRVEPRALDRQVTGHDPPPAVLLNPPVVRLDPGPHPLADVPTGIIPD